MNTLCIIMVDDGVIFITTAKDPKISNVIIQYLGQK